MRDGATGRSRGFGFLTFKDPKTVNTVMVKEHFLDGKIVRLSISDKSSAFSATGPSHSRPSHFGCSSEAIVPEAWKPEPIPICGCEKDGCLPNIGKIDPKRAIPRDEQEKTSKIFVGGVSQEATEHDFKEFFQNFGRVIDATLMMDKDTGRPRGFGFVTFDSESAVEKCLDQQPLEIHGKMIEVKKAQPRGRMGEDDDHRGLRGRGKFTRGSDDRYMDNFGNGGGGGSGGGDGASGGGGNGNTGHFMPATHNLQGGGNLTGPGVNGMTPQMMAQYWQRMQQYFAMMQQQMAASVMQGNMGSMLNPQMMAQLQQMQQMQQQSQAGSMSPGPQSPGAPPNMANMAAAMQGMNPQMQQMMQMMQNQQQQQQQGGIAGGPNSSLGMVGRGGSVGAPGVGANHPGAAGGVRPGFNAHDQLAFEQQKYESQMTRPQSSFHQSNQLNRHQTQQQQQQQQQPPNQTGSGPSSWEGMYDDVPQPNAGGGVIRNLTPLNGKAGPPKGPGGATPPQPSNAPANAPTGPKNAGRPGANFRAGGRGGGGSLAGGAAAGGGIGGSGGGSGAAASGAGGQGARFHPYGR